MCMCVLPIEGTGVIGGDCYVCNAWQSICYGWRMLGLHIVHGREHVKRKEEECLKKRISP